MEATVKQNVRQTGEALQERVGEGFDWAQEKLERSVQRGVDQARGLLGTLDAQIGTLVQESPVLVLAGAFALGYVIARAARAMR